MSNPTYTVGDRVSVSYIRNEDSSPNWVHAFNGEVLEISGPEYAPTLEVKRDDTGDTKTVDAGYAKVDPLD